MKKLWIFGDSFSEPFTKPNGYQEWKPKYIKWKGYDPKCYGEFVSKELNLFPINKAIGGADNYTIFESILLSLNKISEGDIVIIGWSSTLRFRVINKMDNFYTIRPMDIPPDADSKKFNLDISAEALNEILVNRTSKNYITELNNYIMALNFIFTRNKIIHWSPFKQDRDGLNTTFSSLDRYERITDETGGSINDSHFSENAHKELSDHFVNIINNYKNSSSKESLI